MTTSPSFMDKTKKTLTNVFNTLSGKNGFFAALTGNAAIATTGLAAYAFATAAGGNTVPSLIYCALIFAANACIGIEAHEYNQSIKKQEEASRRRMSIN